MRRWQDAWNNDTSYIHRFFSQRCDVYTTPPNPLYIHIFYKCATYYVYLYDSTWCLRKHQKNTFYLQWFVWLYDSCQPHISILYIDLVPSLAERHGQNGRLRFVGFLGLLCSRLEPKTSALSLWTSCALIFYNVGFNVPSRWRWGKVVHVERNRWRFEWYEKTVGFRNHGEIMRGLYT